MKKTESPQDVTIHEVTGDLNTNEKVKGKAAEAAHPSPQPKAEGSLAEMRKAVHGFASCYFTQDRQLRILINIDGKREDLPFHTRNARVAILGALKSLGINVEEQDFRRLIRELEIDDCVFSYSDVPYSRVMAVSAVVNAAGANFLLLGGRETMLKSSKPVIAVGAVRTGCGKSQTSRRIIEILMKRGLKVVAIRHPMPYGDLVSQKVQRFAALSDLEKHKCTVEEMEEYEPHIVRGNVIYAGVDYEAILREAEKDPAGCDLILWDGGNNDFPFYTPDLMVTVVDPHRPGHELGYYPGEVTLRMADVVVINKIDSADSEGIFTVRRNIERVNPSAVVIDAASPIQVEDYEVIRGKRVLVIEDGPTLTHGEMEFGAGTVAAREHGASEIVDPRKWATGGIAQTYKNYPKIGTLLPAMGYWDEQVADLEKTINTVDCDSVVIGTPFDIQRIVKIEKPCAVVTYKHQDIEADGGLGKVIADFIASLK